MRILITNRTLRSRAGTEMYVRDLAVELLRRGHQVVVYSRRQGPMAEILRAATVPVVEDLTQVGFAPDVIHGHHAQEAMTALLHFPDTPGLFVCHDWTAWHDRPPIFPRLLRYVAVDRTCYDRLVCEGGVPVERAEVLSNFVDLARFHARGPLPQRPRRALVFSNYAGAHPYVEAVRKACGARGIALDVVGKRSGNPTDSPETLLPAYDLVFAKGKAAAEAIAAGTAVIVCDRIGAGPLVTAAEFDRLRELSFGRRAFTNAHDPAELGAQIDRYDAADAHAVSTLSRERAGLIQAVDSLLAIYEDLVEEFQDGPPRVCEAELHAAARFLQELTIEPSPGGVKPPGRGLGRLLRRWR